MIDLDKLQKNPGFLAKSPEERQRTLAEAQRRNALEGPPGTYGEAAKRAGWNVLTSVPETALSAANTAYQLWREPKATGRAILQSTPEMLMSMLPMQRTVRKIFTGQPVTGPEVAQEGLEFLGSRLMGRATGRAMKGLAKHTVLGIPGAGAETHAFTIPKAEGLPDSLRPTKTAIQAADAAWQAASGSPLRWHMGKFRDTVEDMLIEQRRLSNPDVGFIGELENYLRTTADGWEPAQLSAEARDLGAKVGGLKAERGRSPEQTTKGRVNAQEASYRRLMSALYQDADAAQPYVQGTFGASPITPSATQVGTAAGPQAGNIGMQQTAGPGAAPQSADLVRLGQLWKQSRALHRQDLAANSLARMIDDSISAVGQEGFESINLRPVIKKIRRAQRKQEYDAQSRLFVNSFQPGEVDDMVKVLRGLQKNLRPIPPGRGVRTGSSQRALHGSIGALAGHYLGIPYIESAAAGMVIAEGLAQAMMTSPGRALVRRAMAIDPTTGRVFHEMIAAFLRGEMQPEAKPLRPVASPTPTATPTPEVPGPTTQDSNKLLHSLVTGGLLPAMPGAQ